MKIIDFERKGNVVRFYLGADDCYDYWGDDWNDSPYDCNAGAVYQDFISGIKDVYFPFDMLVLEPSSGWSKTWYSKEDMKKRRVPCIIAVPKEIHEQCWDDSFSKYVGADGIQKFYFEDHVDPDENT